MNGQLRSAVIAGLIAFVIYVVIALATGGTAAASFGVGAILGVATMIVTFAISTLISRSKRSA